MKHWQPSENFSFADESEHPRFYQETYQRPPNGILDTLRQLWHWDDLAAEISQESQARVAIVGLANSGKNTLYNYLRGWPVANVVNTFNGSTASGAVFVESYGAFVLADLPRQDRLSMVAGEELIMALGDPALLVYLLDGDRGIQDADSRWLSVLRACGKPVQLALNKVDKVEDPDCMLHQIEQMVGMKVIPISALSGEKVEELLLPSLMDIAPRLAVPLGREIVGLRRLAARRVTRRLMLLAGMMSAQPVPLLDIPLQIMVQVGLVMRIGAIYGQTPSGGFNREVAGAVAASLALNYAAQTALKFLPVLGWVASGSLGALGIWLIGEAAIFYYEGTLTHVSRATSQRMDVLKRLSRRLAARLTQIRPLPRSPWSVQHREEEE